MTKKGKKTKNGTPFWWEASDSQKELLKGKFKKFESARKLLKSLENRA